MAIYRWEQQPFFRVGNAPSSNLPTLNPSFLDPTIALFSASLAGNLWVAHFGNPLDFVLRGVNVNTYSIYYYTPWWAQGKTGCGLVRDAPGCTISSLGSCSNCCTAILGGDRSLCSEMAQVGTLQPHRELVIFLFMGVAGGVLGAFLVVLNERVCFSWKLEVLREEGRDRMHTRWQPCTMLPAQEETRVLHWCMR